MKWELPSRENKWSTKFALFPRIVGNTLIWLEWYDVSDVYYIQEEDDYGWYERYPSQIKTSKKP